MILINLLPYREERRKQRKQAFFASIGLSVVVGGVIVGLLWMMLQMLIANQQQRNVYLEGEIARLDAQIKDIATLREEIDSLKKRQEAVERLQGERNLPVHLLNELAKLAPEGVYFTEVKQADKQVTLKGLAQSQERISELLRNTSHDSEWLLQPKLSEIKLASVGTNTRDAKRLFDFQMSVTIKGAEPAADAASQPGAAGAKKG